jgi:hypothetical protein
MGISENTNVATVVAVKACPVCGAVPDMRKKSLGRPNGGGYPDHYEYQYTCSHCMLLKGDEAHDIYVEPAEAINRAKRLWNLAVERIQKFLDSRKSE